MKSRAAIVALLYLTGCSASGPRFHETRFATEPPPADKARLIFLRQEESPIGDPAAALFVDGARVAELKNKGFTVVDTLPGERAIGAEKWGEQGRFVLKLNLVAGKTYYMRVSRREEYYKHMMLPVFFGIAGGIAAAALTDDGGPVKIEPIEAAEATKLLPDFRLSE